MTQSLLSGLGRNYLGNALLSSSTNMSYSQQVSIFNGTINAQDFTSQTVFSIAAELQPKR